LEKNKIIYSNHNKNSIDIELDNINNEPEFIQCAPSPQKIEH